MSTLPKGSTPLPAGVAERRAEVFDRLRGHVENVECAECIGHDRTRPGGDPNGRFAVLAQGNDGKLLELTRCSSLARAVRTAESHVSEGWMIHGAYDLDILAGDDPLPMEGDRVNFEDQGEHYIVGVRDELIEGEIAYTYDLDFDANADPDSATYREVRDDEFTIIERGEPDERLPVKHAVAAVRNIVVFDTVAS